ncbi:hypothetical protein CHS0354_024338 [Potamilus streckersoni]|uniref:StAR-related lipid transfer protein 7, mitochondrial n=1 Tax=Potamilus streckersoni TaxID=2493646 RepID=A0AAE0TK45_9BIVA|nr:hypothetical protein CHS0354_024338 [Potamilus streckersoni]
MSFDKLFLNLRVVFHRTVSCHKFGNRNELLHRVVTLGFGPNGPRYVHERYISLIKKCVIFSRLIARQCNVIAAQRIRRASQIVTLYEKLYGEKVTSKLLNRLGQLVKNSRGRLSYVILSALMFSWDEHRVTDEQMKSCVNDMVHIEQQGKETTGSDYLQEWEQIINKDHFKLWRKPVPNSHLYLYKVYGTFFDIPPRAFYNVQVDLDYRKKWDQLVIQLNVVDKDEETGSEVIQWIIHYPYPMYSRDYVYVRRYMVDTNRNIMVVMSRAIDHPKCPIDNMYVRVSMYQSMMVIRPHKSFDENGFDYVMTYCDDPQSAFPSVAYNWMAKKGVPDFVEKLHVAARDLHKQTGCSSQPQVSSSSVATEQSDYNNSSNSFQQQQYY